MISFLGVRTDGQTDGQTDRQTDTVLESSHGNMSAHKKFQLKAQNLWLAVDPYMPPRRTGMHKNNRRGDTNYSVRLFGPPNHGMSPPVRNILGHLW